MLVCPRCRREIKFILQEQQCLVNCQSKTLKPGSVTIRYLCPECNYELPQKEWISGNAIRRPVEDEKLTKQLSKLDPKDLLTVLIESHMLREQAKV